MGKTAYQRRDWVKGVRRGYVRRKYTEVTCEMCGVKFRQNAGNQRFCGSYTTKTGCSYLRCHELWKAKEKLYRKTKPKWWVEKRKRAQKKFKETHPNYIKEYNRKYRAQNKLTSI